MQLNLFGEEPVEAPIIAPIEDVVSTPKKYKLVPPTNIVLDSDDQQIQNNIQKENIVTQKVKKEKTVSVKSNANPEVITEPVKKKQPRIRTIIALDLFAEVIPAQIETPIPEAISESISEIIPEVISTVTQEEFPEAIAEIITEVIPETISAITQESIQEISSDEMSEVLPVAVPEKTLETFPAQESTPISAKSSNQAKGKYVLRVPNVIKIEETKPIKKIEQVIIPEVKPTKIEEVVNLTLPEPLEKNDLDISPSIITDNIEEVVNITLPEPLEKNDLDISPSIITDEEELSVKSSRGRNSVSHFHADLLLINIPDDDILFTKQYYPISEVATMFNVKVSLLRFWENEFDILKPRKNRKGDRLFRPEDVKSLKLIYFLLREKKYTIEGAKMFIKKGKNVKEKFAAIESLKKIKGMLMELKASLSF